ncbi:hypothetical protein ACMV8I_04835 [Ewingella sp. S1.OA.A_B6]
MAIVSYPAKSDTKALDRKYIQSNDFKEDMADFDLSNIIRVEKFWISERLL